MLCDTFGSDRRTSNYNTKNSKMRRVKMKEKSSTVLLLIIVSWRDSTKSSPTRLPLVGTHLRKSCNNNNLPVALHQKLFLFFGLVRLFQSAPRQVTEKRLQKKCHQ